MDDTKLLTYAELAAALGITPASAKRLAIRRGWQKTLGNDGKARVIVPVERLEAAASDDSGDTAGDDPRDDTGDASGDVTGDEATAFSVLTRHIERLEGKLSELKASLEAERVRAAEVSPLRTHLEAEQRRSSELREERDIARQRASQVDALRAVLEVEQRRAAELKVERDRWQEKATAPRGLWGGGLAADPIFFEMLFFIKKTLNILRF